MIPPAVVKELTRPQTPDAVGRWILEPREWLRVRRPMVRLPKFPAKLGAGEREAITLAEEISAELLLVDDGTGRQEARRRGLAVRGTLGVLGLAARHGLTDFPTAIARLRATNFRVSEELVQSLLEEHA